MKPLNEPLQVISRSVLETVSGETVAVGCSHCLDGDTPRRDAQDEANCNRLRDCWNAAHGLELPADLPPGIFADFVKSMRLIGTQALSPDWTADQAFEFMRAEAREAVAKLSVKRTPATIDRQCLQDEVREARDMLRELRDAVDGLKAGGNPIRIMDTALREAMVKADALLEGNPAPVSPQREKDREHVVQMNARETDALREWLKRPSGAHGKNPRVTFEAVENGGLLVLTEPYTYPEPENKQLKFYQDVMSLPTGPVSEDPHGMLVEPPEPGTTFLRLRPDERELLLGLVEAGIATHDDLPPGDNIFRRKSEQFLPVYQALKEKLGSNNEPVSPAT